MGGQETMADMTRLGFMHVPCSQFGRLVDCGMRSKMELNRTCKDTFPELESQSRGGSVWTRVRAFSSWKLSNYEAMEINETWREWLRNIHNVNRVAAVAVQSGRWKRKRQSFESLLGTTTGVCWRVLTTFGQCQIVTWKRLLLEALGAGASKPPLFKTCISQDCFTQFVCVFSQNVLVCSSGWCDFTA